MATPNSSTELASAARISRRYSPNVRCRRAVPRLASWMAARAMPSPTTSVSMWPASDSRASEFVSRPATTSTTMNTASSPKATVSRPLWRSPARTPPWLWSWRCWSW